MYDIDRENLENLKKEFRETATCFAWWIIRKTKEKFIKSIEAKKMLKEYSKKITQPLQYFGTPLTRKIAKVGWAAEIVGIAYKKKFDVGKF